jgi:hypothetical protein
LIPDATVLTPAGSETVVKSHAARAEPMPASSTAAVAAVNSKPDFIGLISALLKRAVNPRWPISTNLNTSEADGLGGADRGPT